jgi:hypothetical protein
MGTSFPDRLELILSDNRQEIIARIIEEPSHSLKLVFACSPPFVRRKKRPYL